MNVKPKLEHRLEQNYVAIKSKLKREEIPSVLPPLIPELFNWLSKNNIEPAGAPFFNYIKMDDEMEVEVGIPTSSNIKGDERVQPGSFPEGRYAVAKHVGPYNRLFEFNAAIEKWKDENHLKFKSSKVEFYPTDPVVEPNSEKWETIVINKIDED